MKKYSVLVECTIKMYKEFQEDPFKDVGWRSEDAPRMTVEDCEVL
jgi:hypothetical protein